MMTTLLALQRGIFLFLASARLIFFRNPINDYRSLPLRRRVSLSMRLVVRSFIFTEMLTSIRCICNGPAKRAMRPSLDRSRPLPAS